ncbi:interleukin-like EMT inducer domain-containing protein [uncultured Acinetobacter sp.]|uniref:interleukin-like EMT inducer domain-containing protein n=1 Tax=uncultured Acinetobacter sp. TaxID=165433 RepID=UPI00258860B6|nr:interleukin-like EMT inducer domain-containing protein [uncultured Acinetobacter sp.]
MSNGILKQIRAKKTGSVKAGSSPVGAIPSVADPTLQAWIKSISQEVGAASKKYVRTSELAKAGLIDENGQINIPGANEDENSTIVPKAVLNLSATGGYSAITLTWDTVNSKFFEKNEVYRAESDDFGKAINIGSTVGNVYTDYIGNSVKGFYWVRSVSKGGVLGELSKSVFAETSIDIDYLIESLQGQVNEGTLSKTLMSKIEVIDDLNEDVIKLNADAKQIKEDTKNAINELITDIDANQNKAAQEANAIREKFNSEIFTLNNNIGTEIEKRRQDSILLSNGVNHAQTTADNVTNDLINYKSSVENSFANVQDKIKVATEENTANAEKITQIDSSLKGTDFKAATALQTAQTAVNETQSLASQTQALRANIGAAVLSSIPQVEQPNKFAALVVTRSADVSPNQIPSYEHLANRTVILASYLTKDQLFNTSGMDGSIGFFRAIIFVAETKTVLIQGLVGDDAHAVYLDTKLKYSSVVQTTNNPQDVTLELLAGWHTLDFAFNNKSGGWGIKYNNSISGQVNEFYASTIDFVDKANSSYVEQIEATANQAETTANTAMMHMSALFSNVGDATAQISEIKQTKANKNEVSSIVQTALQSVWQSDAAAAVSSLQIGGVNLVRYSAGKFQPQRNTIDNYEYDVAHALLENGQTYTVSAKSNGVFTATHYASDGESDRATVWISSPDGSNLKVISNENTATTGTTFVWDGQSGWCPIRVNGYKADNSTWVSNIQIERGTKRTDWKQSPYDFEWTVINSGAANLNDFYKTSGKWFIQTGAINAPIAPWLYLIVERAGDDRVIQTVYRDMDASQGRWTRFLFNGTWSVWTKLATGKDLNDLSANISQTYQTKTDAQQAIASLTQQIDTKAGKDALNQTNANILNNYATKSNVSESVATATQTLTSSFQTADQNVLNSAAQDATNKANDAKTAAAQDASNKAENAKNQAAIDATNKANAAVSTASADVRNYAYSKSQVDSSLASSIQRLNASIQIGGTNLLKNSAPFSTNDGYPFFQTELTEYPKENELMTLTVWGALEPNTIMSAYNSGGWVDMTNLTLVKENTYQSTFLWKIGASSNTHLFLYAINHQGGQTTRVDKVKLERGSKGTDWTPAPVDTTNAINLVNASLQDFKQVQVQANAAQTTRFEQVESRIGTNESAVQNIQLTKANKSDVSNIVQTELSSTWKSDAITEIAKIKIGGENLLQGTREFLTTDSFQSNYQGYGQRYEADLLFGRSRVMIVSQNWQGFRLTGFADEVLPFDAVLSFWARVLEGQTFSRLYNVAGGNNQYVDISGNAWKQYSLQLPKGTRVSNKDTLQGFEFDLNWNSQIAYAQVQLQTGNTATDWHESPFDVQVGGRNLILNSDFANDLANWTVYSATVEINTAVIENRNVKYAFISSTQGGLYVKPENQSYAAKSGDMVTVSFYARGNGNIIVGFDDGVWKNIVVTDTDNGAFKRYSVTLVRKWNANLFFYCRDGATYLDLALPKYELGSKATGWTPAPEDFIDSLKTFKSTVSQTYQTKTDAQQTTATLTQQLDSKATTQQLNETKANIENTYATKSDLSGSVASSEQKFSAKIGDLKTYTLMSIGGNYAGSAGILNANGVSIQGMARSWGVFFFVNGNLINGYIYDVFGTSWGAQAIADRIYEQDENTWIAVLTFDEPAGNVTDAMRDALVSIGATRKTLQSLEYRDSYILFGKRGLLEGDGLERRGSGKQVTLPIQFVNGVPTGIAGQSGSVAAIAANASYIQSVDVRLAEANGQLASAIQQTNTLTQTVNSIGDKADAATILAKSAALSKKQYVDLQSSQFNQDYWYPIGIRLSIDGKKATLQVSATLGASGKPYWADHYSGFSCNILWDTNAAGWGTTPIERNVLSFVYGWTKSAISPILDLNQLTPSSTEVIWLRGGGRYLFEMPDNAFIQMPDSSGALIDAADGGAAPARQYDAQYVPKSLAAKLNTNTITVQQQMQVLDGIKALAAMRIDNNGVFAGWGITSELLNNGQVFSEIGFQADRFFFMAPDGKSYPFIIDNGKAVFNSDVYIRNGSIKSAQIGELGADKITSGDIAADRMRANIVEAVQGKFQNLSSLTARIGHLRSADSGRRFEITENGMFCYDENNRLRGFFGSRRQ